MNHIVKYNVFESFAYENGCIMLELPISNWNEILSIINEEDIYDVQGGKIPFGLQKRAHLTLLYPIKNDVTFDEVRQKLDGVVKDEPINIVTKKIEVFDGNNYDILVIKVEDNYWKGIEFFKGYTGFDIMEFFQPNAGKRKIMNYENIELWEYNAPTILTLEEWFELEKQEIHQIVLDDKK